MNFIARDGKRTSARLVCPVGCLLLLFSLVAPSAFAQSDTGYRYGIAPGVFVTDRSSKMRVDGEVPGSGTPVDLEGDLGLDASDTVFRLDGYFRFNPSHRLDFSVFDLSRSGSRAIDEEIEWDGTVYPIDIEVSADIDFTVYKLAYTWSFRKRENSYLGITAGAYVANIGSRLAATSIGERSGRGLTAALPVVGLRGERYFAGNWTFRASAELFALEYDDYDGSLYDLYAGLDYRVHRHLAVGAGINSVRINVAVDKTRYSGDLDWRYTGGLLFLKLDF
jgi:hypothetical protein